MQVAINALLFALGFLIATAVAIHPQNSRSSIVTFLNRLRYVTNGLKSGSVSGKLENAQLLAEREGREIDHDASGLLTRDEVEKQYNMDSWQRLAFEDFKTTILAKGSGLRTFPCIYATMGYRSNDHRYVFLDSDDPSAPRNIRHLAPALLSYLRLSHSLGPNTSLVIMCAPSATPKSVEEYNNSFWDMLRGLRIWDPKPWPADIPENTLHSKWTFCFNGEPLFPVSLTPAHSRRWSRHSVVPLIALQPKWVLDELLSSPEKRDAATGKVRKLLAAYDQIEISPDLTSYGDPGTSEVRQLCLLDENRQAECPYENFDR